MRIVVCVRQGLDGELGPFDACAYEAALQVEGAEVVLLSMGPASVAEFLTRLTRLGASGGILLCDKAFAGADTLATARVLSAAVEKMHPDYVFCGRQTLIGDTGQTPPMVSQLLGYQMVSNVMEILKVSQRQISCKTRENTVTVSSPAVLTVERINNLRLPKLRSKTAHVEIWSMDDLGLDPARCGLSGSPTRVLNTFENQSGKRKCTFISRAELENVIALGLEKYRENTKKNEEIPGETLTKVAIIGDSPRSFAQSVSENITVFPLTDVTDLTEKIRQLAPNAVLWGSDGASKEMAARVAANLGLGLCADCTGLGVENGELLMYRPALSGRVMAKIRSTTVPAMATVRTTGNSQSDIVLAVGYGVKDEISRAEEFAQKIGATLASSRKLVDHDFMPYCAQVGLTGKMVSPPVYVAAGISGAVHHIVGMQSAGTVIAINPDKDAPIFEYADYGIIEKF